MKAKLAVILGTRPEIIKLYTLIAELRSHFELVIIHTGQHYSKELNQNQLDIFKLKIDHQIDSYDKDATVQLANMISKIGPLLAQINPKAVVIHGDTNSTLAGALCARKNNIPLIHIESGARCFNKNVPEEQNRIVADHFSTLNFCYDKESFLNLKNEGIRENIFKFSNTAYSTCHYINSKYLKSYKGKSNYVLVTIHRSENTDNPKNLKSIVGLLNHLANSQRIIFPIHPRTNKLLKENKLTLSEKIETITPVDYLDFLKLLKCATFVISDSGGVVDESVYFNIPLIIVRAKTERNDLVKQKKIKQINPEIGEKKLITTVDKIIKNDLKKMRKKKIAFDPNAAKKIAKIISKHIIKNQMV